MKKIILAAMVTCVLAFTANAQVMKKGDNALNIGIGVPANVYGSVRIPAIIGAFDVGVTDKLGIGYISAGGQVAFSGGKDVWDTKATDFVFGARAAYHFDFVEISGNKAFDKFDIYAGFFLGVKLRTYNYDYDYDKDPTVGFNEDVFVGARYALNKNIKLYAEAGYNIAYISAGIVFSF